VKGTPSALVVKEMKHLIYSLVCHSFCIPVTLENKNEISLKSYVRLNFDNFSDNFLSRQQNLNIYNIKMY